MRYSILIGLYCLLSYLPVTYAQQNYDLYWFSFKDKNNSPYSLFRPQEYLSARAIERRANQGIWVDSTDLPINPQYIAEITKEGYHIRFRSRWLNGVAVAVNEEQAKELQKLPFVKEVRPIGFLRKSQYPKTGVGARDYKNTYKKNKNYYGGAQNQIQMLNGHYIHAMGYKGEGMHVAVMDGGFNFMPETPAFDSLFIKKQIIETFDFLENDSYVFESSEHGTDVLSTMAANLPYLQVGTAPYANYYLYKTEDELGEYVQEEYSWITAVEYADSIGISVVNTSLGYYDFDDNNMDYGFADMNGKYSPMSIAANIAAQKGMIIVTSAGNEGDGVWKHITSPGDAPDVLTVAAVDRDGFRAKFSSMGFTNRHYIKPDLAARGHSAIVAYRGRYETRYQFGTSFSSPIMAGMVTALWQACPQSKAQEVVHTLRRAGSQFSRPDTMLGYGIPDFLKAYSELSPTVVNINDPKTDCYYFVGSSQHFVDVFIQRAPTESFSVEVLDIFQRNVHSAQVSATVGEAAHHRIALQALPSGTYTAYLRFGEKTYRVLIAKHEGI